MRRLFFATVSALCYSLVEKACGDDSARRTHRLNETVQFVLEQQGRMPDFLRAPMLLLTLGFNAQAFLKTGLPFHRQERAMRLAQVQSWQSSRLGVKRDFIRFYETLALLAWFSE